MRRTLAIIIFNKRGLFILNVKQTLHLAELSVRPTLHLVKLDAKLTLHLVFYKKELAT